MTSTNTTNTTNNTSSSSSNSSAFHPFSSSPGAGSTTSTASAGSSMPSPPSQHLFEAANSYYIPQHANQMPQQAWFNSDQMMVNVPSQPGVITDSFGMPTSYAHYSPIGQPAQIIPQAQTIQNAVPQTAPTPQATSTRGRKQRKNALGIDKKAYQATMKPIIERQRRARINSSLEELHTLLRDLSSANSGTRQPHNSPNGDNGSTRRIEKADILEQAVRFIKNLQASGGADAFKLAAASSTTQTQAHSQVQSHRSSSPNSQSNGLQMAAVQQAFCAGYAECTKLTTAWLASQTNDCDVAKASTSHDESRISAVEIDEHSIADDTAGDEFLAVEDDTQEGKDMQFKVGEGQELRAKLEEHLVCQLNDRLAAHINKLSNMPMPTPPQSPKDLLLPFLAMPGAAMAQGASVSGSMMPQPMGGAYPQQNIMTQQFQPAPAAYTAQQPMQSQASDFMYYSDPTQPTTSNDALAEMVDPKDPVGSAMVNIVGAALSHSQCMPQFATDRPWRPWVCQNN